MRATESESETSGVERGEMAEAPAEHHMGPCPPETLIECLYQRHYDELLRHALTFVADLQAAEDACHTVFLRLIQRKDRPAEVTLAYLKTAVRHACFDQKKRLRRLAPLPPAMDIPNPLSNDTDDAASRDALLASLLDRLPQKVREVMDLRLGGLSYQDIALALRMPSKTVDTILTRARAQLRAHVLAEREREREREKPRRHTGHRARHHPLPDHDPIPWSRSVRACTGMASTPSPSG